MILLNKILVLLVYFSVVSLLVNPLLIDSAFAQKNTQIFNKDKKMCYLVLAGGDEDERLKEEPDPTLLAATSIGQEFNFLKGQAKAGSTSTSDQVKDQKEFTDAINSLKSSCKAGDETVIFFFGHQGKDGRLGIYEQKMVGDKIKPELKDVITPEELKEILSGFQEGTTVSFYGCGCTGIAAEKIVEQAVDDKGKPYGDNFNYWGAKPVVGTKEWGIFKRPLGDETGNNFPDVGDDNGVTTTEEYEQGLKQHKPNWFISFEPSPDIGDDLACSVPDTGDSLVGGNIIPIDATALLLAGSYTAASWILPILVAGAGVIVVLVKRK